MSLADARTAARQVLGGRAPVPRSTGQTFEALCDVFLERASIRPTTEHEYRRIISRDLTAWRGRLVASLTRDDAFGVLDPIIERGSKVEANRTHQLMGSLFECCCGPRLDSKQRRERNPQAGRSRTAPRAPLDVDEAEQLWLALDAEKPEIAAAVRFILLTAQRKSEVGLTWNELDFKNWTWTLPPTRAKNRREHTIPLSPSARAILQAQSKSTGAGPHFDYSPEIRILRSYSQARVFPNVSGKLSRTMARVCERTRLAPTTVHDLRRTATSLMATAGVQQVVLILKLILNHSDRNDITAMYVRYLYDQERAEAVNNSDAMIQDAVAALRLPNPAEAGQAT
jgi:integrase